MRSIPECLRQSLILDISVEERQKLLAREPLPEDNTSIADYVWLPLRFDGEMVYIDWKEEWSLDDYE